MLRAARPAAVLDQDRHDRATRSTVAFRCTWPPAGAGIPTPVSAAARLRARPRLSVPRHDLAPAVSSTSTRTGARDHKPIVNRVKISTPRQLQIDQLSRRTNTTRRPSPLNSNSRRSSALDKLSPASNATSPGPIHRLVTRGYGRRRAPGGSAHNLHLCTATTARITSRVASCPPAAPPPKSACRIVGRVYTHPGRGAPTLAGQDGRVPGCRPSAAPSPSTSKLPPHPSQA